MSVGERIRRLRQERGWSQAQLGRRLNVHQKQISGYERGAHVPSTEVLIELARQFNVSLDYLAFNDREDHSTTKIADRELVQRLAEIERLSEQDKATVKAVIDTFVKKSRFERVATDEQGIA